jgi:hypothetical protein
MNRKWADAEKELGFYDNCCFCHRAAPTFSLQARDEAGDQAMGKRRSFSAQARTAAIAALAAAAIAASGRAAEAAGLAVTCTNPFSGASWQIAIDYDLKTVDSNPASIDETEISWRDAKDGWRYTLDRKSGALTVILASATGGNFLHDQCQLPN